MRDPLIDRENVYLAASRRACEAARMQIGQSVGSESVVPELTRWCKHTLFGTDALKTWSEGQTLSDLMTLPTEQSPLRSFAGIADEARRRSLQDGFTALLVGSENEWKNGLAWGFGQALANAMVGHLAEEKIPSQCLLPGIWNLVKSHELTYCAFTEALPELLRNSPPAMLEILSDLRTRFDDINTNPGVGAFSMERQGFNDFVDAWRINRSIEELWKFREHWLPIPYDLLDLVACMLTADSVAVLRLLDHFDFPHPIRQVLQHPTILHDREAIANALEVAPICSDDNRTWNHSLPALLLLEAAERHCQDLWEAACRADDPEKADSGILERTKAILVLWFEALGRIVMAREDGPFLGPQWLLLKTVDERMDRARRNATGDRRLTRLRQDDLIEWIAGGLSKAGLVGDQVAALVGFPSRPHSDQGARAKPDSPVGRQAAPRLGAFSMMVVLDHMIGDGTSGDGQRLLDDLDALLEARDPAFETEATLGQEPRDLPATCYGYLLARTDDPALRWWKSWELLVEQRRRAQYWRETQDGDALAPALFLLAAGTSAIDWLMSLPDPHSDKAGELWSGLFDGARECWLTVSLGHLIERVETDIGRLFARHPMVFRGSDEQGCTSEPDAAGIAGSYADLLARHLGMLGGDDVMLTICCLNACRNGAPLETMSTLLKRNTGNIANMLDQFERWQELERPVRKRTDVVAELTELRGNIKRFGTP